MSKHKFTDIFCIAIIIAMLAVAFGFIYSPNWGVAAAQEQPEYADKLFSTDKVHTIDIQVKDTLWQEMLDNAKAEEYIEATLVIDGEKVSGVGLRPKGNSSLAMIATSESDRFSLKIEFDHFSNSIGYHGLDKLVLNNIAQDNTYMKDYITYQMMNEMGADAPLSSFIWVTVNGEDWGLYLAAEGVEESFAQRVYGTTSGEIYKPDMMDMNDIGNFQPGANGGAFPGGVNGEIPDMGNLPGMPENGEMPQRPDFGGQPGQMPDPANRPDFGPNGGPGGFGGMGGGGTSLVYVDDDQASYSAIFDNAIFDPSQADKARLIESLKQLNSGENIDQVVDVDEVIRYFAVHNFVLNSDSYTGSLLHNYYLAEHDGKLSMIAWDYNLAFGGMGGVGMGRNPGGADPNTEPTGPTETVDSATSMVNYPIDSPMLAGSTDDKPMIAWIFDNEEYLEKYHAVYAEYVEYFTSDRFTQMYDNAIALISPYVEKDPTAFCTYEDFQAGSSALREFCLLRAESISGQLEGTIASTSDGQNETKANFVDASGIDMESMGSSSMGFGRARGSMIPGPVNEGTETNQGNGTDQPTETNSTTAADGVSTAPPDGAAGIPGRGEFTPPAGIENIPAEGNAQQLPEETTTTPVTQSNAIVLSGSAAVLIGGILFARKRKR